MQLKKWSILILSIFIITVSAGCTLKEEPAQTKIEKMELKESKKEADEKSSYLHDEVLELFPELKKVKAHLFEQYADVLAGEEIKNERPPIEFYYTGKERFFPRMSMGVNFKENVTKEQMIEAVSYMIEQLKLLFPKEEQLQLEASALIAYTKDGVMKDELVYSNMGFAAKSVENSDEIYWEAKQAPDYEWKSFHPNIDDISLSLSKLQTSLEKLGIKKSDVSQSDEGNYFSSGADDKLFTGYVVVADSNQKVQFILCAIYEKDTITKTFINKVKNSFQKYIIVLYEQKEKEYLEASSFISENIDAVIKGEERSIEIGQWELELYSLENAIHLQVLKK